MFLSLEPLPTLTKHPHTGECFNLLKIAAQEDRNVLLKVQHLQKQPENLKTTTESSNAFFMNNKVLSGLDRLLRR